MLEITFLKKRIEEQRRALYRLATNKEMALSRKIEIMKSAKGQLEYFRDEYKKLVPVKKKEDSFTRWMIIANKVELCKIFLLESECIHGSTDKWYFKAVYNDGEYFFSELGVIMPEPGFSTLDQAKNYNKKGFCFEIKNHE